MKKTEDMRNTLKAGMIIRVHQKIKDVNKKGEEKERIQIFEGITLAVKHGREAGATFTVRKVSNGVGVEKIFPIHAPTVTLVELVREMDVRQSNSYYLRDHKKKLKEVRKNKKAKEVGSVADLIGEVKEEEIVPAEPPAEEVVEEKVEEKEATTEEAAA